MKQLFEFQKTALNSVKNNKNALLAWQMGTGKTVSSIELAKMYNDSVLICLVLKSTVSQWIEELTNQTDGMKIFNGYRHSKKDGISAFIEYDGRKALVIGYDAFKTKTNKALRDYITENEGNITMICDESSLIGNIHSMRTKSVMKTKSNHKIFLSGTPATGGKMENIIPTANMLGWDISYEEFLYQFCYHKRITDPFRPWVSFEIIEGYHDIELMREKLKQHGTSFLTMEEAGVQLPEKQTVIVSGDKPREYRQFCKTGIVEVNGEEIVGENVLTKMLYARQLCTCMYNNDRAAAIEDLLNTAAGETVVIFYNWVAEFEALKKICDSINRPVDYVNGSGKSLKNYESGNSETVILCQYQAASMGLNLQNARICIFASLCCSFSDFDQAIARTHRIGQKRNTMFYIPLCEGSVEEKIYYTLMERKDYTVQLFTEQKVG